jgi:hypothetical protein
MANNLGATSTVQLGATSTAEDVLSGINLRGRRILVTGVSAGLGLETARALAAHGGRSWVRHGICRRLKLQPRRCERTLR